MRDISFVLVLIISVFLLIFYDEVLENDESDDTIIFKIYNSKYFTLIYWLILLILSILVFIASLIERKKLA